jgi:hypothetical protein
MLLGMLESSTLQSRSSTTFCNYVRTDPYLLPERIVVFYKGERMGEATRLDFLANDRPPRPLEDPPNTTAADRN